MKKTILILMGVLAAAAFADRTANRDWVGQNFAPSNLVPRVEAVEDALTNGTRIAIGKGAVAMTNETVQIGAGTNATAGTLQFRSWPLVGADGKIPSGRLPAMTESDPSFTAWKNGDRITLGKETVADESGGTAIGSYAVAKGYSAVALGTEAWAQGDYAVQIGAGYNMSPGTLNFREWRLLDAEGKIPKERFSNDTGSIPTKSDEMVRVGPLVLGAEPVQLGYGVYKVRDPWDKSTWGVDPSSMYTEADWHFDGTVYIGPDGLAVYGYDYFHFIINDRWVSFGESVKEQITPAVVLEKIKAMNDTQKAELKAFLGIQ